VISAIGGILLYFSERSAAFAHLGFGDGLLNAFFYTVTPRSGGLQSIDMLSFHGSSMLLIIVLMFIGAGAGSTGGGIKAGTIGLIAAYIYARLKGRPDLSLWNRTIPKESIDKAIGVAAVVGLFTVVTSLVLMYIETHDLTSYQSRVNFVQIIFESVSAACTVGLSLDFTSQLSETGKLFISLVMLIGRLSPIGLAIAITARHAKSKYKYAEENIIIG
jgi:trk system potassium uptake protein TrkH